MHLNIRSLSKHYDDLVAFLASIGKSFDIIGCSETWMSEQTLLDIYKIDGYSLYCINRQDRIGGGVCLYVSQCLLCFHWVSTRGPFLPVSIHPGTTFPIILVGPITGDYSLLFPIMLLVSVHIYPVCVSSCYGVIIVCHSSTLRSVFKSVVVLVCLFCFVYSLSD